MKVRLAVGNLIDFPAEILVNAIGENLVASCGKSRVSNAVARAAGPSLQKEYDDIITRRGKHLDFGDIEITGAYDLSPRFKTIIAVASAVPIYEQMERALGGILLIADTAGYKSITMPAFGTGRGKLPMADFAKIFDKQFLIANGSCLNARMQHISVVFSDLQSLQEFRENSQLAAEVFELEPQP